MNPIRTAWSPAAWALAVVGLVATPALADPPGMGMGKPHPGAGPHVGMGMSGGMGHKGMGTGHGMRPHNAAVHFLMMADGLGLDEVQQDHLRKLRDDWIESNATNEARLKAAEADLNEMLEADTIDLKRVDAQLAIVGKVEGQLWHAFAAQLKAIKDLLTDDQHVRLRAHHRMGMGPGMMGPGQGR